MATPYLLVLLLLTLCLSAWANSISATGSPSTSVSMAPLTPPARSLAFTHSPTHSPVMSRPPSHSPRPTPSISHTLRPSISSFGHYNHSGHITMVIDDFSAGTWQRAAWRTEAGQQLTSNFEAPQPCGETILGCSRSMTLQANTTSSSNVELGGATILPHVHFHKKGSCWFIPAYPNLSSNLTLQYDGDDDPNSLNIHGLGGVDFTANGRTQALVFSIFGVYYAVRSIELQFYDIYGKQCIGQMPGVTNCHFYLPQTFFFRHLSGNCNMKQIGAFQMVVVPDGYDAIALGRIQLVDFVHPDWISGGARC